MIAEGSRIGSKTGPKPKPKPEISWQAKVRGKVQSRLGNVKKARTTGKGWMGFDFIMSEASVMNGSKRD